MKTKALMREGGWCLFGALLLALPGQAATPDQATTKIYLSLNNFCALEATSDVVLTPTQKDFESDQITASKAIRLKIQTNDLKGCTVTVRKAQESTLRQGDLMLRGSSGNNIVNFGNYRAPTPTEMPLYKSQSSDGNPVDCYLDVRVKNLRKYTGGAGGSGSKLVYTDTLTFTILPN